MHHRPTQAALPPFTDARSRGKRAAIRRLASKGTALGRVAQFFGCTEETVRRIVRNDAPPYADDVAADPAFLVEWDAAVMDVDGEGEDAAVVQGSEGSEFRPGEDSSEGSDSGSGSDSEECGSSSEPPFKRRASARLRREPAPRVLRSAWIVGGSLTGVFCRCAHVAVAGYRPAHAPSQVAECSRGGG